MTASKPDPRAIEALFQEALAAHRAGDLARAEAGYRQAIARAPGHAGAWHMSGLIALAHDRLEQAAARLGTAAGLARAWEIHYDLGYVMERLGRDDAAEACYRQAIALNPRCAEAHYNLGVLYAKLGRLDAAVVAYRETLAIDPGHLGAANNLGLALRAQGHWQAAANCFQAVSRAVPEHAEALNNLASLRVEQQDYVAAAEYFRRLARLRDDDGHAAGKLAHLARQLCDWHDLPGLDAALTRPEILASRFPVAPFDALACVAERARLRDIARHHAEIACATALDAPPLAPRRAARRDGPLRLGYMSGDPRNHPVTHLILGVLRAHDRQAFDIRLYSHGPGRDTTRAWVRDLGYPFVDMLGMTDADIAARIAADEVDILVDLSGYTQHGRPLVNALRPAPIIVNWLGFPGSLGHPRLADYLIGDATLTPPEHAADYSETLALLPGCHQPIDNTQAIAATPRRAEVGLPEHGVVFCCFNQAYKLNPDILALWRALLREVPDSVLWLLEPPTGALENLRRTWAALGIDPARLILAPMLPLDEHLGRVRLADIALDTHPYGSGATGGNMLWAGVPMVTRLGETYVGRMGASLLRAAGLPELVADDDAAYLRIATRLARDAALLDDIKRRLAGHPAPALFDTSAYTRDLERLYKRMWSDHLHGARQTIILAPASPFGE